MHGGCWRGQATRRAALGEISAEGMTQLAQAELRLVFFVRSLGVAEAR
jgi:hypothetical protein